MGHGPGLWPAVRNVKHNTKEGASPNDDGDHARGCPRHWPPICGSCPSGPGPLLALAFRPSGRSRSPPKRIGNRRGPCWNECGSDGYPLCCSPRLKALRLLALLFFRIIFIKGMSLLDVPATFSSLAKNGGSFAFCCDAI